MSPAKNNKPKVVKGEARELILQAAQKLIALHGVEGVSTRSINQAAGVSAGILHYHFGSLEGVVEALLERHMAPLMAERQGILQALEQQPAIELRQVLEALVHPLARKLIGEAETGVAYVRFLARIFSDHNPAIEALSGRYLGHGPNLVFRLICRALPHLPREVLKQRTIPMAHALLHTLADPGFFALPINGTPAETAEAQWRRVNGLIDYLAGGLATAVSPTASEPASP